jgi:hypothetical protein
MFWVEPDNFVTSEYEFNTTEPYRQTFPAERYFQKDSVIYKNKLFSKLMICPDCDVIVASYKLCYEKTPLTYDIKYLYFPSYHACTKSHFCNTTYKSERERDYCVDYPRALWW